MKADYGIICNNFDEALTINGELGQSGVVGCKMVGDHTLVLALICEINIEQVEYGGVEEAVILVPSVVLHLGFKQHFSIFAPGGAHGRVAAAERRAVQSDVGPT